MFKEVATGILPDGVLDLLLVLLLGQEIVFKVRVGCCGTRVIKVIDEVDGGFVWVVVGASVGRNVRGLCRVVRVLN